MMPNQNNAPSRTRFLFGSAFAVLIVGTVFFTGLPHLFSRTYDRDAAVSGATTSVEEKKEKKPSVTHLETPEPLKAIYMSQCVVGTPSFREKLKTLIEETELNAVVIDIKDFTGKIAFQTDNPAVAPSVSDGCGAYDMKGFIEELHASGIYVIARITVFQDPFYTEMHPELAVKKASDGTVWKDFKGLSFIDVGAKPFWEYIVEVSKETYDIGFDELNFDYIRFPSDGNMKDIAFTWTGEKTKAEMLEAFFEYLYENLSEPWDDNEGVPKLSADLFGYTTTNSDDLGIGQVIERALPYFHYVMPMVYPSHYNSGFIGIEKPATQPYEVVKYSMDAAVRRAQAMAASAVSSATTTAITELRELANRGHGDISPNQLRPWLQDFDLGATYTPDMVRAQMQATYDAGLTSWALWDAGNTYTRAALIEDGEVSETLTEIQ